MPTLEQLVKQDEKLKARVRKRAPRIIRLLTKKHGYSCVDIAKLAKCTSAHLGLIRRGDGHASYRLYLNLEKTLRIVEHMKGKS